MDGKEKSFRDQLIRGLVSFEDQENASGMAQILTLIGLNLDTTTIVLPLVAGERVLGLMGVWGDDLQESNISPLNMFAS